MNRFLTLFKFLVIPLLYMLTTLSFSAHGASLWYSIQQKRPLEGAQLDGSEKIVVEADEQGPAIRSVRFKIDGDRVGTDTVAPFELQADLDAVGVGPHVLTAIIRYDDGTAETAQASLVLAGDHTPPPVPVPPLSKEHIEVWTFSQGLSVFRVGAPWDGVMVRVNTGSSVNTKKSWIDTDKNGTPSHRIWTNPAQGWINPIYNTPHDITTVVIWVSGERQAVKGWLSDLRAMTKLLREYYTPNIRIFYQSVIGPPKGRLCKGVRASDNYADIVSAISMHANEEPNVFEGPNELARVASCNCYRDSKGHLTSNCNAALSRTLRPWYEALGGDKMSP